MFSIHNNPFSQYNYESCTREKNLQELAKALFVSEVLLIKNNLVLHNCNLSILPVNFGCLTHLLDLYLNENQLKSLPESLGNLTQLRSLYLNNNQLSFLPPTIGNLTQLQELTLSDNRLNTVPDAIGNLIHLRELTLYNNPLTTIPECLFRLSPNCVIYMGNNMIPQTELKALHARISAPGYNGPKFDFFFQDQS